MKRKLLSYILMIAMVASMFPIFPVYAADTQSQTETFAVTRAATGNTPQVLTGSTTGKTLTSGIYYLTGNVSFTNSTGSGLTIAEGATVVIDLNGRTLTAKGAAATAGSSGRGGGAGIHVPSDATLVFIGSGTVNATGGNAASGTDGQAGNDGYWVRNAAYVYGGQGGAGGNGGGGAGAGIGTPGGVGGAGGATTSRQYANRWAEAYIDPVLGYRNLGTAGASPAGMGSLYVLGSVGVTAKGGSAGKGGGANGYTRNVKAVITRTDSVLYTSDWTYVCASSGDNGSGGGGGGSAYAVGTGGGGGGGGTSGMPGPLSTREVSNEHPSDVFDYLNGRYFNFGYDWNQATGGKGPNSNNGANAVEDNWFDKAITGYVTTGEDSYNVYNASSGYWGYITKGGGERPYEGGAAGAASAAKAPIKYSSATISGVSASNYTTYLSGDKYNINISLIDTNSGTTNAAAATAGSNAAVSGTAHSREGYTLKGYYTAASGGSKVLNADLSIVNSTVSGYTINGLWNTAANTKLYAQWTANDYTVTLNPNGGSGGTASVKATYDAAFPSFTRPARTGYTFNGFYTSASGGEQVFDANGAMVNNVSGYTGSGVWQRAENTTLYAQWTPVQYIVQLEGNGAKTLSKIVWVKFDSRLRDFPQNWNKNGYSLKGFYTELTGGIQILGADCNLASENIDGYVKNGGWQRTEKTVLYAQWSANNYTVTLNDNGGSGGTSSVTATYDSAFPDFTKPVKNGYVLTGYYTEADGGTQVLNADGTVVNNVSGYTGSGVWQRTEVTTLYAQWVGANYGVLLHANGGSGETLDIAAQYEAAFPTFTKHTKTGYTLLGYYTAAVGGTKVLNADGSVVNNVSGYTGNGIWLRTDSTELYAQWEANLITVNLNKSYETGSTSFRVYYDAPKLVSELVHSRSGYVLTGYYTQKDGGIKVINSDGTFVSDAEGYTSGGVWKRDENTELYAQWVLAKAYLAPRVNGDATYWSSSKTLAFGLPSGYSIDANNNLVSADGTTVSGTDVSAEGSVGRVYFYSIGDTGYFINVNSPEADIYITNAKYLFCNCTKLTGFDFTAAKLDTSECTTMESMFQSCQALRSFKWPEEFDTSNVTSMRALFYGCSEITDIDITNLKTENVADMSYMFYNCRALSSLIQPDTFVTAKVGAGASSSNQIGVRSMFVNCNSLTELDLSAWNLSGFDYYWGAQGLFGWPGESMMQNLKVLYLPAKVSDTILASTHFDVLNLYSDANTHETKLRAAQTPGECVRIRYTVTYDANGGTGTTQQYYLHDINGNATTLSLLDGSGFAKKYYTLSSWNTDASGSGTAYELGNSFSVTNSDTTLYASWSQNTGNAYLHGASLDNSYSWRRKWIISQYGYAPTRDSDDGYLANISEVHVGKLPEGYYIDSEDGFKLKSTDNESVAYEPLDVSTDTSPVPCYLYTLGEEGKYTLYFANGFNPDAEVYHREYASWMFKRLVNATLIDVSGLNTSVAPDISGMFHGCSSLTSIDISNFDRSMKYTNIWGMFYDCHGIEELDLSGFDFSSCTESSAHAAMFQNMNNLKVLTLPDKVSSAYTTNLNITLYGDDADMTEYKTLPAANPEIGLTSLRARYDITYHSSFDEDATEMGYMLHNIPATASENEFTRNGYRFITWTEDVKGEGTAYWHGDELPVNTVLDLYAQWNELTPYMKNYGNDASNPYKNLKELYISGVPDGFSINSSYQLTDGTDNYDGIDVSDYEIGEGTVYLYTVGDTGYIINPYIPSSEIYLGDNASYLFYDCNALTKLDFGKLNTSNVTDMSNMFQYCRSLKEVDLTGLDTSNVTKMNSMFNRCFNLSKLDISGFDTSNVTDMAYMFYDCGKLEEITFPESFVTEKVTSANGMFHTSDQSYTNGDFTVECEAPKLTSLDMSSWDLSGVTNTGYMLNMKTLREIKLPAKVGTTDVSLTGLNLFKTAEDEAEQAVLTAAASEGESICYRYTVAYKANYEGGTDNAGYFLYGDTDYKIDYSKLSREHFALSNLTTASDGSGESFADKASYSENADLELWAQWTAGAYTVALDDNGGEGGLTSISAVYGSEMPTLSTLPTREGYTFTGYFDEASDGEKYYNADGTSDKISDLTDEDTLYAHWKVNTYNISFNLNGGNWADEYTAPTEYTYGTVTILPDSDDIVLDGMAFDGWYTDVDYSGERVTTITASDLGDKKFFAKWVETSFTVVASCADTMQDVDDSDSGMDVYANDTVTIEVTVDGGSFTNAEWTLVYDSSKFEYVSETLHENAQKAVTGNNVLGGIIRGAAGQTSGNEFKDGTVVVTYVFKAIPQVRAEVTGKFMITEAYANTYTMAGDIDKRIANKTGTEVTILHVDDEAAGTEVPTGSIKNLEVTYNAMAQSGNSYVLDDGFSKATVTYAAVDADGNAIDDETDIDGNGVADVIESLSYRSVIPTWTNVGEYTYYVKISGYGLATIYDSATFTILPKPVTPTVTFAVDPSVDKVTITPVINGVLDETYTGKVTVNVNDSDYTFNAEDFRYDGETTAVCKESFDVTAPFGGLLEIKAVYTSGTDDNYANGEGSADIDVDKITADDKTIEQLEKSVTSIFPYDAMEHFVEFADVPEGWTYSTPVDTFDGTENPSVKSVDDEKLVKTVFTDNAGIYNDVVVYSALKIVPANVRITVHDKTKEIGEDDPEFTKTVEIVNEDGDVIKTGLYGTDEDDMKIVLSRKAGETKGTYPITASYVPNKNYKVEVVMGKLEIGAPVIEPENPDDEPLVKIEVVDLSKGNPQGDIQPDYIAGKRLILVYTNVDKAYYGYGTPDSYEKLFDVTDAGYRYVDNNYDAGTFTEDKTEYDHVYGIVVDKVGEYEASEAYEKLYREKIIFLGSDESFAPEDIVYNADINLTEELDVNDYSMNNGIYNTRYARITYMISILKADYNHDKVVDTSDSLAVRDAVVNVKQ